MKKLLLVVLVCSLSAAWSCAKQAEAPEAEAASAAEDTAASAEDVNGDGLTEEEQKAFLRDETVSAQENIEIEDAEETLKTLENEVNAEFKELKLPTPPKDIAALPTLKDGNPSETFGKEEELTEEEKKLRKEQYESDLRTMKYIRFYKKKQAEKEATFEPEDIASNAK